MKSDTNGRLHDPSLRELTAELDGLRELLLSKLDALNGKLDERDKLYTERDTSRRTAVEAALTAVKEQTKQSFDASEKAIVKAEDAQKSYNISHNDLARKMDDQNKATMPRTETESRFHAVEEKITALRDAVTTVGSGVSSQIAALTGAQLGGQSVKDESRANIAILIAFLGMLLTVGIALFRFGVAK
jgi:hypothetical protein